MRSNLSCCFTTDGSNYDYLEANSGKPSHRLPQLELSPSEFGSLPETYKAALKEQAFRQLHKVMAPSGSIIALTAKGEREAYSLAAIDNRDTSNRPDTIPDMTVIKGDQIIGILSSEAWRKGEASEIGKHVPQPLPAYKVPQRELTASERQVADWLSQPGRKVTTAKKVDRLASLMAKFWDTGDGSKWTQPVDPRNAELRAGRAAA